VDAFLQDNLCLVRLIPVASDSDGFMDGGERIRLCALALLARGCDIQAMCRSATSVTANIDLVGEGRWHTTKSLESKGLGRYVCFSSRREHSRALPIEGCHVGLTGASKPATMASEWLAG